MPFNLNVSTVRIQAPSDWSDDDVTEDMFEAMEEAFEVHMSSFQNSLTAIKEGLKVNFTF